ncbi:DUF4844 domain-containing protein [Spirosoma rigui]|uniref:DUF4844 domain-containing protein n=1 Tax=Spirosoma rigui TaxID=564064 RepID=UPI0009AF2846|nr:DUF4844 domain-containing protein [Spirosoma rigui]
MNKPKLTPEAQLARLTFYRNHEKFPNPDWENRELPVPDEPQREKMNKAVNDFIDFLIVLIERGDTEPEEFKENIQAYVDNWDVLHYDTDEIDFIIDVECAVMRVVGVDCSELAL